MCFGAQVDKGQQLCPACLLDEQGITFFNAMSKEQRRKEQAGEGNRKKQKPTHAAPYGLKSAVTAKNTFGYLRIMKSKTCERRYGAKNEVRALSFRRAIQ